MRRYNFTVNFLLLAVLTLTTCFVNAQTNVDEDTCSGLTNKTECCAQDGCYFLSCVNKTDETKNHSGCHKKGENVTSICKEGSNSTLCTGETTTPQPTTATPTTDTCKDKSQEDCCNPTSGDCVFYSCNGTDSKPHTGCHMPSANKSEFCKDADAAKDMCKETPTSTPAPSPTAAPPTAAPAPTDDCAKYSNQTICCQHTADNCSFVSCTGLDDSTHTGCHGSAADRSSFCKDVSQVTDLCKESPTSTPAVTTTAKAPDNSANTGSSDDGGQRFDGASFIGGFVLCAGLVAITCFGLKFYKAKTERNYHTL